MHSKSFFPLLSLIIIMLCASCTKIQNPESGSNDKTEADSVAEMMYDAYDAFKYSDAIEYGQTALQKYETLKDTTSMCDVMSTMSLANLRLGNVAEGIRIVERTIYLDSIKGDPEMLSVDYNTMAGMYLSEDKGTEAEPFVLKAIECELRTEKQQHISNRYGIASEVYCKMHLPDKAIDYAKKGLDVAVQRKDTAQIGTRMSQLAQAYIAANRMDEAERTMKESITILQQTHNDLSLAVTYRQLGNIYEDRKQIATAVAYYEKAMELSRKINYSMLLCQCTQAVGELTATTQPARAIALLKESRALADTLHSHKVDELMADFASRYDLNEKRRTIEEQAAELKIHRMLLAIIAVALVAIAIVTLLGIWMKRLRRRHEQLEARYSAKVVEQTQHQEPELTAADKEFIEKLAAYVEEHIAVSDLSSTTMAEAFFLSPRQFSRRVKQLTGIDTTHYIRASRVLKARKMLTDTDLPIKDIYVRCGFESASYFARIFRTDVGVSPTEYRQKSAI